MLPAALQPSSEAEQGTYRSRGSVTLIVLALHIGVLLFLFDTLGRVFIPEPPAIAPMLVRFFDQPRGQHRDSDRLALRPRFIKPTALLADSPPKIRIDIPIETPPAPVPSEISASLLSGSKDVQGVGTPRGKTEGVDEGAGHAILHQVAPVYSAASAMAHEHGDVTLRVLVDAQGGPSQIRITSSSGFPRLDQSADEAVKHYRFSPPGKEAQASGYWTTVKVEFDLLRMPVPTSIVAFDSAIKDQITAAERTKTHLSPEVLQTDAMVRRLAGNLFDALSHGAGAGEPGMQSVRATLTPIQVLARQGKLKWVRFAGLASSDFDCGRGTPSVASRTARCEIFEVRQVGGSSYWLTLVEGSGTALENVAIMMDSKLAGRENIVR